ncbi:MAG: HD-GYP domain-containing protein [Deferribacteres bacterium]|nr:HD-GYP domain-containing protein [Deferribacteres bacterium]
MIKKIKTEQLKVGMYVHDFNCGWLRHPFLTNSAKIRDDKTIEKIIDAGIRELYIDTDKGLDVAGAPTEKEVKQEIQAELNRIAAKPKPDNIKSVSVQEELIRAKEIKKEAKKTVQKIMEDIRLGRQLELEKAEHVVGKMVNSIFRNKDALASLGRIKKTDEYTFFHSVGVSVLMISFAKHLGLDPELIKIIGTGALLHDIGKMKVPLEILNKPGRLTEDEFAKIKEHVEHGRRILKEYPGIDEVSVLVAAQHHERFDGSGYPNGLKGDAISKFGQMAAIADVYDAITSDRCYHKGMLPTEALRKIFEWGEFHFNKELVHQFIRCMGIYPVGTLVSLESGLLGIILDRGEKSLLHPTVRIVYDMKKGRYVTPYDVDLAQPLNGGGDRVKSYESPARWKIKLENYL